MLSGSILIWDKRMGINNLLGDLYQVYNKLKNATLHSYSGTFNSKKVKQRKISLLGRSQAEFLFQIGH